MGRQTNSAGEFPSDLLVDLGDRGGRGVRLRLEEALRSGIQAGRLMPGAPLPPTRVLAAELGISRSVVVEAYANLRTDGYLEARTGAGTRVRPEAGSGRSTTDGRGRARSRAGRWFDLCGALTRRTAPRRSGSWPAFPTPPCSPARVGFVTTGPRSPACPTRS
ncbi:MAG: GntR family transcriptional regulator [Solirubrobacteraceae bacterium]